MLNNSNDQYFNPSSPDQTLSSEISGDLPATPKVDFDIWSKLSLSYTDVGINVEANVTSASELHSLIDAFSMLCNTTPPPVVSHGSNLGSTPPRSPLSEYSSSSAPNLTVCRNKSTKLKPVNYFANVSKLGQINKPNSKHGQNSLRQVVDACIDTFFTCWVKSTPILRRDDFMEWYLSQPDPTNTLIVNAICVAYFRHMILHHSPPELSHFISDPDKIQEQEEYFFDRAREILSQSFDTPDRFTIIALLLIVPRAEPSRRLQYAGMAISALHELEIYPRILEESDDESYEKELDTRLWWFVWAWEFYLYSSSSLKSSSRPLVPGNNIDMPRILEQDIDTDEISVIHYVYCLKLWKIQAHFISTMYEQESEMTVQQLQEYDRQLLAFYAELPEYFKFGSGFEYGHGDLFLACIRVNIEYNATRIILHKLFIPEVTDTRPTKTSLESLNICLKMALKQLPTFKSSQVLPNGRCVYDRDEIWRASEVISIAMDIYRTCVSTEDRDIILQGIQASEFESGLLKAYDLVKESVEYNLSNRNWIQIFNWLEVEIRRHELYRRSKSESVDIISNNKQPDYFLANLKTDTQRTELVHKDSPMPTVVIPDSNGNIKRRNSRKPSKRHCNIPSSKPIKALNNDTSMNNLQHQFQISPTPTSLSPTFTSPSSTSSSHVQFTMQSFNPSMDFKDSQDNIKHQPKFKYFSPKKMNKYMFIDDNPMAQ